MEENLKNAQKKFLFYSEGRFRIRLEGIIMPPHIKGWVL